MPFQFTIYINLMFKLGRLFYRCAKHKPSLSSIPPQIQQATANTQLIQTQILKRKNALISLHQQTQSLIDEKIVFPVKLCGTMDQYSEHFSYLPDRVMSFYKIPKKTITDYLLKMYKASLYAIADQNIQYMNEYWEQGLIKSTLEVIKKINNEYTVKVIQENDFLDYYQESCQIVDAVMIRGLSMNRQQNQSPQEYIKYAEEKDVGLITYTPKYITEGGRQFIDPKLNKKVYDGYQKMVLRILVRIRSPLQINIKQFQVDPEINTREHLCIMENQMIAPIHLQSNYKLQTLMEWLGKYRFGAWKVVDIDNFMKGNSLFKLYEKEEELDEVFKGTKLDKSSYVDLRVF